MISRILIANRGEIAVRIIRTARLMGISTVAVYSLADRDALHVQLADDAVCIGPASAAESYLNMNALIQAACATGCDAIHPGYGFLSESPRFARLCQACGLLFIGPDASLMELMSDKTKARLCMQKAGLPVIAGGLSCADARQGLQQAEATGFPVMIKAAFGGGGKGIRIVRRPEDFVFQWNQASREAEACFGNGTLFVEKYIENPRHIEVQVAADRHGHCLHLGARDCSFQVRHQKMMEETPCAGVSVSVCSAMEEAAVKACLAVGYDSVGTVEFLVDAQENFWFLEMNTRIQVEHPVTELVWNVDLVELQIRAAAGEVLPLQQVDLHPSGHALECRINAQDVTREFAPACGTIDFLHLPGGSSVRVDTALYAGCQVTPFYDSMICKVIAWAPERAMCLQRMNCALEEMVITGVQTNTDYLYLSLNTPEFQQGICTTASAGEFARRMNEYESV